MVIFLASAIYGGGMALSNITQKISDYVDGQVEKKQDDIEFSSLPAKIDRIEASLSILLESDQARIRGEIVKYHEKFTSQGWIDLYSLDYIQKQANCYFKEGGNSYVHQLVDELTDLPHKPLPGQSIVKEQA